MDDFVEDVPALALTSLIYPNPALDHPDSAKEDDLVVAAQVAIDQTPPEALHESVNNEDLISDVANVLVDMSDFLIDDDDPVVDTSTNNDFWSSLYSASNKNEQQPQQQQEELSPSPSRLDSEWGYVFQKKHTNKRKKISTYNSDVVSSSTGVYSSDVSGALSALSSALSLSSESSAEREDALCGLDFEIMNPPNEIQLAQSNFGEKGKTNEANFVVPAVGMEFSSEEEVYKFYKTYAEKSGFCVRKGKVQRRSDGTIRKRYFYCSKEGKKQDKETIYKRKETRTSCSARISCKLIENEKWNISEFVEGHNHHFECANKISKIHDHHVVNYAQVEVESSVGTEQSAAANIDDKVSVLINLEEVQCLLNYFSHLKAEEEDLSFFSAVQHDDDDGRAKNFFWTDGRSKIDFKHFGDVLILDKTFKMDNRMICAPLFGLNHHRQYVLFDCALLLDETTQSFVWLLQTFLKAMGITVQPKTILTDESSTMTDAIKEVFPEAKHLIGLWYVRRNAASFSNYCGKPGFRSLFDRWFFEHEHTEEEFNSKWFSMLELFDLRDNPWLNIMYLSREKWAPSFNKTTFAAGVQDTTSIDGMFQNLIEHAKTMTLFVTEYLTLLAQQRKKESFGDFLSKQKKREILLNDNLIEEQAALKYTCRMFKLFQRELVKCLLLEIEEISRNETTAKFILTEEDGNYRSIVEFNSSDSTAVCSCGKHESLGILCCHVLRVFRERRVSQIPPQYVLQRWTKF